jgi:small subunit ribosomal protein S9
MAKKPPKKEKVAKKPEKELPLKASRAKKVTSYYSGVGRRKSAVARVRVFLNESKTEKAAGQSANISINEKPYVEFFCVPELREIVISPLKLSGEKNNLKISVRVRGGGTRGQAEAVRLGIARALVAIDGSLRKTLRDIGYLTRDARITERKKAGLKKARRAPQWKKR